MNLLTQLVLAAGITASGLVAYSYADTQDKLIRLDNESRSMARRQIDDYKMLVRHWQNTCHQEYQACDQKVLVDYGAKASHEPADFQQSAREYNQCIAQRQECGDRAVNAYGVLLSSQWQDRRALYGSFLCSPNLVARVGLHLDTVLSIFQEEPDFTNSTGALRFFKDREFQQEQDCGTGPGSTFYSPSDFYSDAPLTVIAGH